LLLCERYLKAGGLSVECGSTENMFALVQTVLNFDLTLDVTEYFSASIERK